MRSAFFLCGGERGRGCVRRDGVWRRYGSLFGGGGDDDGGTNGDGGGCFGDGGDFGDANFGDGGAGDSGVMQQAIVYGHSADTLDSVDPNTKSVSVVGNFSGCGGWSY